METRENRRNKIRREWRWFKKKERCSKTKRKCKIKTLRVGTTAREIKEKIKREKKHNNKK